jgi:hypothetical protein
MARRTIFVLTLAAWLAVSLVAAAAMGGAPQGQAKTQSAQPGSSTDGIAHVTLGQAAAPLYGPWKFTVGDSPMNPKTGKPLWAEPGFDDSKWESVDLTPRPGVVDPFYGDPRYVPGWTSLGHQGYMGWAWYRLQIVVQVEPSQQLALEGPFWADDSYQVFANGTLLGSFGRFRGPGETPVGYESRPAMFLLPPATVGASEGSRLISETVAFRVWMGPAGLLHNPEPGGLRYAPEFGGAQSVAAQDKLNWHELILGDSFAAFEGLALLLLGIVAASLILFDRSDAVYLWVAAVLWLWALLDAFGLVSGTTEWVSNRTFLFLFQSVYLPLHLGGWVMVWWVWFRLRRPAWLPSVIAALTLTYMVFGALAEDILPWVPPHLVSVAIQAAPAVVRLLFMVVLVFIVSKGIRMDGPSGWLVLPAIVPLAALQFQTEFIQIGLPSVWHPFGIAIFMDYLANIFLAAAVSLLLLRRLLLSVRRQRQMALDVKQAQEVQRVILPEARTVLPGLLIESEYRPAREVGGDFFQIIPHKTDGSLLIVAGDVTGKGLKAGMLVALLVGAIRTEEHHHTNPAGMLSTLNQRLLGRADAQATCLAMRINADGCATLANAGHVPPYLNGEPLPIEGALPLGMVEGAEFSVLRFQLKEGDRLMLLSDGVAEATDANGKLFGFERVSELLHTATTAAEIAGVAQAFGQEDDISVISVTRTTVRELALA